MFKKSDSIFFINTFIYLLFITQTVSTKGCNTYILSILSIYQKKIASANPFKRNGLHNALGTKPKCGEGQTKLKKRLYKM